MNIFSDIITSRNNPLIKWAASLSSKKGRDEARAFIAEGEKLSVEALEAGLPVSHIFVLEDKKERIFEKIAPFMNSEKYEKTNVIVARDTAFEKISTENSPQGIITVIKYLDFFNNIDIIYKEEFFIQPTERVIVLASLRDPGNLGAVIRSATAFGVDHIILTADSADLYNPKTVRSAMGSLFRVKATVVSDMKSFVDAMRHNGRRVLAAELTDSAKAISEIGFNSSDAVIIGNEGHGIPRELSQICDASVYIPISKKTESLNAAVAAAIFMWELGK